MERTLTETAHAMNGKICLVTGATAGIGLVTARELARRGATVVLVGRNAERGRQATETIQRETGNAAVEFLSADLSSQAEVRNLARQFLARYPRLHVLVNNAGAMYALRQESVDGIEMTLALNHLAPFLLTNLLLDALKAAAPARIVNLASAAHEDVDGFDFTDPEAARTGGLGSYPRSELASLFYSLALPWAHPGFQQYARTKLANVLFTVELAQRLAGTGVTANALHPGLVASDFAAGNGVYGWFMRRYVGLRGIDVEQGAATSIVLATSPELEQVSGRYFADRRLARCSAAASDREAAAKLWQLSEELARDPAAPR
jgi:NAD(P)-dependent dehydrogenase (short-subunit alcohol dehydrogenase family)